MTDPEKPDRGTAAMLERIRNRRTALGLNGSELARRAAISPSYVSLIERGHKVPNEDVAARLAAALEDDEELYRAWARGERYGFEGLASLQRLDDLTSDARTSRILASGRDLPPMPMAARSPAGLPLGKPLRSRLSHAQEIVTAEEQKRALASGAELDRFLIEDRAEGRRGEPADFVQEPPLEAEEEPSEPVPDLVVEVPVLQAGEDPRRMLDATTLPPLHLDARLVGSTSGLFAYELDRAAAARLRGIASEGDYIVLTRRVRRLTAERIYAVRGEDERVRLGRVLFKGNALLLLPPAGGSDIEVVPLSEDNAWRERVLGVVVLTLKRWY